MSAWKKQAVPLVFLEIAMGAITKSNGHAPEIKRISARLDKWLDACWEPLRQKQGRISDKQAQMVTTKASRRIQKMLSDVWVDGIKTQAELPGAMLVIAEDTLAAMPRNNPERIKAWKYLHKTLIELYNLADPDWDDNTGQVRGIKIAEVVLKEAGV